MIKDNKPIQIGPLFVQRIVSSSADYRATTQHYWHGYICPWNTPKADISTVGRLIEVTSRQQIEDECRRYRSDVDLFAQVQLAYYEVIDE